MDVWMSVSTFFIGDKEVAPLLLRPLLASQHVLLLLQLLLLSHLVLVLQPLPGSPPGWYLLVGCCWQRTYIALLCAACAMGCTCTPGRLASDLLLLSLLLLLLPLLLLATGAALGGTATASLKCLVEQQGTQGKAKCGSVQVRVESTLLFILNFMPAGPASMAQQ